MRSRVVSCLVLAVALLVPVGAGPVQATTQSACEFTRGGYRGWQLCGTFWTSFTYADGREEVFIIGLDYAVWHIWQTSSTDPDAWSGWASLGGRIHWPDAEGNGVLLHNSTTPDRPVIRVIGTDRWWWCNHLVVLDLQSPQWFGWYRC